MPKAAAIILCAWLLRAAPPLLAWGDKPHADITDAALSVVPPEDDLSGRLGVEAYRLRIYVHLADWVDSLIEMREQWKVTAASFSSPGAAFYGNDYLVFPPCPRPNGHIVPEVLATYRPFFERALQALRTESPTNAARWMGSLLHYVTDTGSPPHAAGIRGDLHTKMENWLDASRIAMGGYQPKLLGLSDRVAEDNFVQRMDGLIAFSKARADRLRPLAERNDRPACEPIALESASETARVTADVIHTLLVLTAKEHGGADLKAEVTAPELPIAETMPVKLALLGTTFSTMSDIVVVRPGVYRGTLLLRNLPPGTYQPVISRVGSKMLIGTAFTVASGDHLRLHWDLSPDTVKDNLVRNPDFSIRWVSRSGPDYWHFDKTRNAWISDNIRVVAEENYRVSFSTNGGHARAVAIQWMEEHWLPLGDPVVLSSSGAIISAPSKTKYVRLVISGQDDPSRGIGSIYLARQISHGEGAVGQFVPSR